MMLAHRASPYSVKLGAMPWSFLGESRLLAKHQGLENLGPLRAARLPAMKQRSEQSTERCGTDFGRDGNSQTLTCSRPNGDLVAKSPGALARPGAAHLESQLQLGFYFSKQNYSNYLKLILLILFSFSSAFTGNSENQFPFCVQVHSHFWELVFREYRKLHFQSALLMLSNQNPGKTITINM